MPVKRESRVSAFTELLQVGLIPKGKLLEIVGAMLFTSQVPTQQLQTAEATMNGEATDVIFHLFVIGVST